MYLLHGPGYNSWQPQAQTNNKIRHSAGIKSNWDYRTYMQNNADYIMKYNSMEAYNSSGVSPFASGNNIQVSNTPYLFGSLYNESKPFGYVNSDLKESFLEKERLQGRMISPSISTTLPNFGGK